MTLWYVDNTASGANNGTSWVNAWESFADIVWSGAGVVANDTLYISGGTTSKIYRETLTNAAVSGSSGNLITITKGVDGSHDGTAKIYGSTAVATWEPEGGNVWKATLVTEPTSVWFIETDDSITWGTEDGTPDAEYDWYWDTGELFCYAASDPDARYSSVEASTRDSCVLINNEGYIDLNNIECAFSNKRGVWVYNTSAQYVNIDNMTIHHISGKNASTGEGIHFNLCSNNMASTNLVHNCGRHGIFVSPGNNTTIEGNEIYDCFHTGIDLQSGANIATTDIIIRYNLIYCTDDYDINYRTLGIFTKATNASYKVDGIEIYYNVIHDIPGNGIEIANLTNDVQILNNVLCRGHASYAGGRYGLQVSIVTATDITIKNNIGIDWADACFNSGNSDITACDYNLWYNTVSVDKYVWYGQSYGVNDFEAYKSASGWDTNGLWESPDFVDKANNDFNLNSSSPCIGEGDPTLGLTQDYDGKAVPYGANPDIGAFEYEEIALEINVELKRA